MQRRHVPWRRTPKWRNWQTRRTQNPVAFGPCGFDPHLRHRMVERKGRGAGMTSGGWGNGWGTRGSGRRERRPDVRRLGVAARPPRLRPLARDAGLAAGVRLTGDGGRARRRAGDRPRRARRGDADRARFRPPSTGLRRPRPRLLGARRGRRDRRARRAEVPAPRSPRAPSPDGRARARLALFPASGGQRRRAGSGRRPLADDVVDLVELVALSGGGADTSAKTDPRRLGGRKWQTRCPFLTTTVG